MAVAIYRRLPQAEMEKKEKRVVRCMEGGRGNLDAGQRKIRVLHTQTTNIYYKVDTLLLLIIISFVVVFYLCSLKEREKNE